MSRNNPYNAIRDMLDNAYEAIDFYEALPRYQAPFGNNAIIEAGLIKGIIRSFEIIGEAVRRIPPEFRERHPHIPWTRIVNFRNVLIHEYERINLDKMYEIIENRLPTLIAQLEAILAEESD